MESHFRVLESFGEAVRLFRTEQDLSQEALGQLCDLDRTYIGGIERGERNPTVESILKVANGLGVRASELFARFERLHEGRE